MKRTFGTKRVALLASVFALQAPVVFFASLAQAQEPQAHHEDGTGKGHGDGTGSGHGDGTGDGKGHAKGEGAAKHQGSGEEQPAFVQGHGGSASHEEGVGGTAGQAGHEDHGSAHETGHGAHGGHEEHALKPINWADFSNKEQAPYPALLINFAILLGIYIHFGKQPVADGLKKRRDEIAKDIEEASRMKQEAEARAKVYQEKLAQLEGELKVARQALVEAGKGEKERIVREAEDRAERMRKDAQLLVEQELAQLRHDLVRDTVNTAMVAAEDMLRASVTPADQERLAEEFLKDLSSKTRSSTVGGAS